MCLQKLSTSKHSWNIIVQFYLTVVNYLLNKCLANCLVKCLVKCLVNDLFTEHDIGNAYGVCVN